MKEVPSSKNNNQLDIQTKTNKTSHCSSYKKGSWSQEEDEQLLQFIQTYGTNSWQTISQFIQGRSSKQCQTRWINVLSPENKQEKWNKEEDRIIFSLFKKLGPQWTKISHHLQGRSANAVKNRYYSTQKKIKNAEKKILQLKESKQLLSLNENEEKEKEKIFQQEPQKATTPQTFQPVNTFSPQPNIQFQNFNIPAQQNFNMHAFSQCNLYPQPYQYQQMNPVYNNVNFVQYGIRIQSLESLVDGLVNKIQNLEERLVSLEDQQEIQKGEGNNF